MNFHVLILAPFFCLLVSGSEDAPQSSLDSRPDSSVNSDADFWKGIDGAEFITELTDDTHDEFKQNPKAFVMYYTTWCGYSKQARRGFAGAAKRLNGKIAFGAADCDKAPNSCRGDHPINGVPTFYFYKDGAWVEEYRGERKTREFVNYLNRK